MSELFNGIVISLMVGAVFFLILDYIDRGKQHKHQWLPWARQCWNDKPLEFSGAFGGRRVFVRVCATCNEVQISMPQIPCDHFRTT